MPLLRLSDRLFVFLEHLDASHSKVMYRALKTKTGLMLFLSLLTLSCLEKSSEVLGLVLQLSSVRGKRSTLERVVERRALTSHTSEPCFSQKEYLALQRNGS
jgi:hypothetical protein